MSTTSAVASRPKAESTRPLDHRKLGMWLFIGSEVMFFSGFIAAFVHFKTLNPGATDILDIPLTTVNSFLLLTSSFTVVSALAVALASGATMVEAAVVANHAAGLVIREIGTASVTPEELSRSLEDVAEVANGG